MKSAASRENGITMHRLSPLSSSRVDSRYDVPFGSRRYLFQLESGLLCRSVALSVDLGSYCDLVPQGLIYCAYFFIFKECNIVPPHNIGALHAAVSVRKSCLVSLLLESKLTPSVRILHTPLCSIILNHMFSVNRILPSAYSRPYETIPQVSQQVSSQHNYLNSSTKTLL